ncbi:hypothetical protein ACH3Y9_36380 [Streptomyces sp. WSLK1-5]|uniref:hypothetical protein n=1 Tax=Streptomyces sp. WSLK1-5 TaxID=3375473 RepID=UPI00378B6DEE
MPTTQAESLLSMRSVQTSGGHSGARTVGNGERVELEPGDLRTPPDQDVPFPEEVDFDHGIDPRPEQMPAKRGDLAGPHGRVGCVHQPRAHGDRFEVAAAFDAPKLSASRMRGQVVVMRPGDIDHQGQKLTDVFLPPEIRLARLAAGLP